MTLTLDFATEQRLQRLVARGAYADPADLIAHLVDLADSDPDDLLTRQTELAAKLQRGYDQATRGELHSPEEARTILAERRAARATQ
jgi:Arc/MetJ-type ribon-helix-helix transcriptional regulator